MSDYMPFHVVWALTNACNVKCIHCYAASKNRSPDELTTNEVLNHLELLARDGLLDVAFSGGEPLLVRSLECIAEKASDLGLTVGVGTNGWALTPKRAKSLAQAGVTRIQISLDGLAQTHDSIRGRKGLFEKSRKAIDNSKDAGITTKVCFTVHRLNWQELIPAFEYALSAGVDGFNLSQLVPTGRGNTEIDLDPHEWREILEWWDSARREHPSITMTMAVMKQDRLFGFLLGGVRSRSRRCG
ncbi:radical SAM protein, partial [Actinomyces bowdenii]|uniref:radical SAM protein n=1 Tax=Actinomyces bowdenii TaxID=131109 RepID=UPI00214C2B98